MIEEDRPSRVAYEVINQSLLADEVMEILNLAERQYAAYVEMQLLECSRHLRDTSYSRLIHSGWDCLRFAVASAALTLGCSPRMAKQVGTIVIDSLASLLEWVDDLKRTDLYSIVREEISELTAPECPSIESHGSEFVARRLVSSITDTIKEIVALLSMTDAAPSDFAGSPPRNARPLGTNAYGL